MNWRALLGGLGGLLLTLPMALLLGSVMRPGLASQEGANISPVLDVEARTQRLTYRRDCADSSDCEPPLGCLFDLRIGAHYCTDSQCMTDEQCPEGLVCRAVATEGAGPLVRTCLPVGVRQEGERCVRLPRDRGAACGPGLLCGGRKGWCGRPCHVHEASDCPEGFFCADVSPQPVCLPSCEARGCGEGQQCVRFDEGVSGCAVVYGPDCQRTPCPQGRQCEALTEARSPGKVWMECVERCGEDFPPCSDGRVCDGWQCKPPCEPEGPDSCPEGYRCKQRRPTSPWVCEPDW